MTVDEIKLGLVNIKSQIATIIYQGCRIEITKQLYGRLKCIRTSMTDSREIPKDIIDELEIYQSSANLETGNEQHKYVSQNVRELDEVMAEGELADRVAGQGLLSQISNGATNYHYMRINDLDEMSAISSLPTFSQRHSYTNSIDENGNECPCFENIFRSKEEAELKQTVNTSNASSVFHDHTVGIDPYLEANMQQRAIAYSRSMMNSPQIRWRSQQEQRLGEQKNWLSRLLSM